MRGKTRKLRRPQITSSSLDKMPRVVPEQRQKFENDDLFRKMSRETEIKYTGYRDRSHEERIVRFQTEARDGHATVAFVSSGTNFTLQFPKGEDGTVPKDFLDFDREPGKVFIKSRFIMNGVCVVWKGWIDLQRLDGAGYLEFDEDKAKSSCLPLEDQELMYYNVIRNVKGCWLV